MPSCDVHLSTPSVHSLSALPQCIYDVLPQSRVSPCKLLWSCVVVGSSTNIGICPAVHAHYVTCCFAMQNAHRAADRHIPLLGPQRLGPVSLGSQPSALSSSRRVLQLPTCLLYISAMAASGLAPERDFQLLVGFFVVHCQVLYKV